MESEAGQSAAIEKWGQHTGELFTQGSMLGKEAKGLGEGMVGGEGRREAAKAGPYIALTTLPSSLVPGVSSPHPHLPAGVSYV